MGFHKNTLKIVYFVSLSMSWACDKKEDDNITSASVLSTSADETEVSINPSFQQDFSAHPDSGIAGTYVSVPAGISSSGFKVRLKQGTTLNTDHLQTIFNLDADLPVLSSGPAVELRPDSSFAPPLLSAIGLTIPLPSDTTGQLVILYRGIQDDGTWAWGLIGADQVTASASTASFSSSYLGVFQAIYLDGIQKTDLSFSNPGAGPWYGYQFDIASELVFPAADDPDTIFSLYDGNGLVQSFSTNGTEVSPPPSFSFSELVTTNPQVFDKSSDSALEPSLFSADFNYGLSFDGDSLNMTGTILQRSNMTSLPTSAVSWSSWEGEISGVAAKTQRGTVYEVLNSGSAAAELTSTSTGFTLAGTWNDQEFTAELDAASTESVANALGFMKGTAQVAGASFTAYGFSSLDQRALALVLCPSGSVCPVGDGSGGFTLDSYQLGILVRD